MATSLRLGKAALRSSLVGAASTPIRSTAFNAFRCYSSAKTQASRGADYDG